MDWAQFCEQYIPGPATITVEAYEGTGAHGDVYAAPVDVTPCVVEDTRRLVRGADGRQVVSETTVYGPPDTVAPANSRVTLPSGRTTTSIAVSVVTAAGLPLPEHVELSCV